MVSREERLGRFQLSSWVVQYKIDVDGSSVKKSGFTSHDIDAFLPVTVSNGGGWLSVVGMGHLLSINLCLPVFYVPECPLWTEMAFVG